MSYTWATFHDALLFVSAERHWHRALAWPTRALVHGAQAALRSLHTIAAQPDTFLDFTRLSFYNQWITVGNLTPFIALLAAVALLCVCWRRLPAAYTLYGIAALLLPLCYPTRSVPLLRPVAFPARRFPALRCAGGRARAAAGAAVGAPCVHARQHDRTHGDVRQ
jgi:hypothetical protein